jgi:DNA-binding FadR family transcriptional regulator
MMSPAAAAIAFWRYWQEMHHIDQPQKEHRQLLDLCVASDVEDACALPKQHTPETGRLLVQRLQSHQLSRCMMTEIRAAAEQCRFLKRKKKSC